MRIAIVHDDFMQWGGAERVVKAMLEIWPQADLYTAIYAKPIVERELSGRKITVSFLQNWVGKKFYRPLFFLHPLAFESFNLADYDLVISSTTRFAKSVITRPETVHVCYCNTPPRFLWPIDPANRRSGILEPLLSYLRLHDYTAAQRVDYFIGNSKEVSRRIKKFYQRESVTIYPFVELERLQAQDQELGPRPPAELARQLPQSFFLIVSRLLPQKRVDLAVKAFNRLPKKNLVIIGDGPERKKLEKIARGNIYFLGYLDDLAVAAYLRRCLSFIYPQKEDFGITALEAQAVGKPVIAYRAGGALETVIEGRTGIFFDAQSSESLAKAVTSFNRANFDSVEIKKNAERFSKKRFIRELKTFVESKVV